MRILWCACLFTGIAFPRTEFWAPLNPPLAHYSADIKYDPASARLEGTETIRFRNDTVRPIGRIQLQWFGDSLTVETGGRPLTKAPGTPSLFDLPADLAPGAELTLSVRFGASWKLNPTTNNAITSTVTPRLWWGQGTLDEYEVRLSAPDGYVWGASGRYDPAKRAYIAERARAFGAFLGQGYESAEASAAGVQVRAVFTPQGRPCAELLLKTAVSAIEFYHRRFGFYPQRSLTIVPGMDYPAGGYPPATALVVVHGQHRMSERPEAFWRWITAHEVGHMYWGDHVLAQGPNSLNWLMIGMGIWADQEYRRANSITSAGQLQDNYGSGILQGRDTTIDITREQESTIRWDFNNIVEHGKSIAMLNALESVLGPINFDAAYCRILHDYAGKRFGWRDLQRVVAAQSGEDLDWFFETWVRSSATAQFRVVSKDCEGADCTVKIQRTGDMPMPLTVVARYEDGTEQRARTDRLAQTDELRFTSKSPIKEVVFDPDHALILADGPPRLKPLSSRIQSLSWNGDPALPLTLYREGLQPKLDDANDRFRLALHLYEGRHYTEALDLLKDDRRFQALVWKGHLLDLLGKRTDAIVEYEAALKVTGSPTFRHDQWKMVIDRKWIEERLKTPFSR